METLQALVQVRVDPTPNFTPTTFVVKCLWEVFFWGCGVLALLCVCVSVSGVVLCRCVCVTC